MSATSWTHPICLTCYATREPGRDPVRLRPIYREAERCGWCGKETREGIYYRGDPATVPFASAKTCE